MREQGREEVERGQDAFHSWLMWRRRRSQEIVAQRARWDGEGGREGWGGMEVRTVGWAAGGMRCVGDCGRLKAAKMSCERASRCPSPVLSSCRASSLPPCAHTPTPTHAHPQPQSHLHSHAPLPTRNPKTLNPAARARRLAGLFPAASAPGAPLEPLRQLLGCMRLSFRIFYSLCSMGLSDVSAGGGGRVG